MAYQSGGIDWGRVPPEKRGRWGRFLYIKRGGHLSDGLTQDAVRDMLAKIGRPLGGSYYSEMESGKKEVNADWQPVFERLWGPLEDWDDPWSEPADEATDLSMVLREIRDELRLSRLAADKNADVLAELLGVVLKGRLVPPGTASEGGAPSAQGRQQE